MQKEEEKYGKKAGFALDPSLIGTGGLVQRFSSTPPSDSECDISNYTLLAQAGVLGLYSDTRVPRSAQPVPDCLQVAFVPALILRQRGLMGSWLPSCSRQSAGTILLISKMTQLGDGNVF
ncbi:uncharacterized [Tachysurus ichikawai]